MKAVCYIRPGVVDAIDMPMPEITDPHEVLIKVAYSAICGDEKKIVSGVMGGNEPPPYILGHEMSGTVAALGEKVLLKNLKVGDRVTGDYSLYCGMCHYCIIGNKQMCDNIEGRSCTSAEYVVWHESQLYKIPDSVGMKEACLTEPLSCCLRGIEQGRISQGSSVAIFGAGGIGLLLLQLAKLKGAANIAVIEPNREKRQLALQLGATVVCDPYTENVYKVAALNTHARGYDTVIEASGNTEAVKPAFEIMGKCGTLVLFSLQDIDFYFPFNLSQFYFKDASIHSVYTGPYMYEKALATIPLLNLDCLTKNVFSYQEAAMVFATEKTKDMPRILIQF